MNTPPNEQRNFVHKRLIKAATSFVTSGFNPLSAVTGFLAPRARRPQPRSRAQPTFERIPIRPLVNIQPPGLRPAQKKFVSEVQALKAAPPIVRIPPPRTLTARPSETSALEKEAGRIAKFSAGEVVQVGLDILAGGCPPLMKRDPVDGKCKFALGEQVGRDDTPPGDVVMGRYGAGEVPGNMVVNRAVCRPGMVVGDDGICYNRSQLKNSEREWPRGRRPLLTGGDMRAIATAARAGRRLERTTKRLQKIGMMKKPAARARRLPPHQHQITSGG